MPPARTDPSETGPPSAAPTQPNAGERKDASTKMPCVDSETLLRGQASVAITHNGTLYRLQATRQGKLILTK